MFNLNKHSINEGFEYLAQKRCKVLHTKKRATTLFTSMVIKTQLSFVSLGTLHPITRKLQRNNEDQKLE